LMVVGFCASEKPPPCTMSDGVEDIPRFTIRWKMLLLYRPFWA
jgi:hypothetical protein